MQTKSRKPSWLRKRIRVTSTQARVGEILSDLRLTTVCDAARCPNKAECFSRAVATFMILGDVCTRDCRFCAVSHGAPRTVDPSEPERVARAARALGLRHVVITSVTRDDLRDGGAGQFVGVLEALQELPRSPSVEVLTPDFEGDRDALYRVLDAHPDVFNHNVETVPRLYPRARPSASFERSLNLLRTVKETFPSVPAKSGLMLGLGEQEAEILEVMHSLRSVKCDILTLGQYLQPSKAHLPVARYVAPREFDHWRQIGYEMGFRYVAAGPFVRSSFDADHALYALESVGSSSETINP